MAWPPLQTRAYLLLLVAALLWVPLLRVPLLGVAWGGGACSTHTHCEQQPAAKTRLMAGCLAWARQIALSPVVHL